MKNHFISYLKGIAIILIMLVHLINWSDMPINTFLYAFKDFCHIGTLYFVALSGSLIIIAYGKYDNVWKANKKLLKRAIILLGIYLLYSLIKFQIYDFSKEPFYQSFMDAGKFNLQSILTFKTYVVPITILLLWCMFLFITPIILYINKHFRYKKETILLLIAFLIFLNYFLIFPRNTITEILYGENFILYGFNLWLLPYFIGIYLGMIGFHKKKFEVLIFFGIITLIFGLYQYNQNLTFFLDSYMFPLKPYFIAACFFIMYIFVYILIWLSKLKKTWINCFLSILKLIGDKTLFIYITHWIVIDFTIWIFRPNATIIWISVPIYLIGFLIYNKKKIIKFKDELNNGNI